MSDAKRISDEKYREALEVLRLHGLERAASLLWGNGSAAAEAFSAGLRSEPLHPVGCRCNRCGG